MGFAYLESFDFLLQLLYEFLHGFTVETLRKLLLRCDWSFLSGTRSDYFSTFGFNSVFFLWVNDLRSLDLR